MAMPKTIRQEMVFERSTKNTHRYVNSDFGSAVSTLYVSQLAFPNGAPPIIILTIQAK